MTEDMTLLKEKIEKQKNHNKNKDLEGYEETCFLGSMRVAVTIGEEVKRK